MSSIVKYQRRRSVYKDKEKIFGQEEELENNHKAVTYFKLNQYSQRLPLENQTFYSGGHSAVRESWRPAGQGEYTLNDNQLLKGTFDKEGFLQGEGEITFFRDGKECSFWSGGFQNGTMSGTGQLKDKNGVIKDCIIKDNTVICCIDELFQGIQIEFLDRSLGLYSGEEYSTKAIILNHILEWKFRVRLHDDVRPRERDVDFAKLRSFKILRHLPRITHLSQLPELKCVEGALSSYDYYQDTYGSKRPPRLGIAGSRKNAEMQPKDITPLEADSRAKSLYNERLFELSVCGVGGAIEFEKKRILKEEKKKQWEVSVAQRRIDQEKQRSKLIENERKKDFESALLKQKEASAERAETLSRQRSDLTSLTTPSLSRQRSDLTGPISRQRSDLSSQKSVE